MRITSSRTAKSARRTLALLGVLVIAISGGLAVQAAGGKADFSLSGSPSSQTINRGQTATYTIGLSRQNGFADAVALSATGLPAASKATFTPSTIASTGNTSTLTVATSVGGKTPGGTYPLTITGKSGKTSRTTTITLVVKEPSQANFSLSASPANQSLLPGDDTTYTLTAARSNGFNGSIALVATGLPANTSAQFSANPIASNATTSVMTIATGATTPEGTYPLEIRGTGQIDGVSQTRIATATLVVQDAGEFRITGSPASSLAPGQSSELNLTLINPNNFALKVSNLAVALEQATSEPKCGSTKHFRVTQATVAYPITVPAGASSTLSELGVPTSRMPRVAMLNLPENQDVCKGVSLHFNYSGTAGK